MKRTIKGSALTLAGILQFLMITGFIQGGQSSGEQAVGFYGEGSLIDPTSVPPEGPGFLKIFRTRNRGWTSLEMMTLVTQASGEIQRDYPDLERLQMGDFSNSKGGLAGGHKSHQNGLDADLVYYRVHPYEQDPNKNSGFAESFVIQDKLSPNFDLRRNWDLISRFVESGIVKRIFVDRVIKQAFCDYAQVQGAAPQTLETLRRLRPLILHDDHLHVRIVCPKNSPRCIEQEDPPVGDGCKDLQLGTQEFDLNDFE